MSEDDVVYPTGGITAFAKRDAVIPTKAQMADPNFAITSIPGWVVLGLRTSDGAPEFAESPAAPQETYEEGFEFSPQNGTLAATQNLAEMNPEILGLLRGVTYVDGVADIDIDSLTDGRIYTEDRLRGKVGDKLERYCGPQATVTAIANPRKARGSMANRQITISLKRSDELEGRGHYRHAIIDADDTPEPVIVSVTPAGQTVGEQIVISGRHFTGMTALTIGGTAVTVKMVAADDTIVATIPTGTIGANKPVIVTTPDGASESYAYTVAAS